MQITGQMNPADIAAVLLATASLVLFICERRRNGTLVRANLERDYRQLLRECIRTCNDAFHAGIAELGRPVGLLELHMPERARARREAKVQSTQEQMRELEALQAEMDEAFDRWDDATLRRQIEVLRDWNSEVLLSIRAARNPPGGN